MNTILLHKYNVPGPRYTSYPTVPFWDKKGIDLDLRVFFESSTEWNTSDFSYFSLK